MRSLLTLVFFITSALDFLVQLLYAYGERSYVFIDCCDLVKNMSLLFFRACLDQILELGKLALYNRARARRRVG